MRRSGLEAARGLIARVTPRAVLLASIGIAWLNYLATARWAHVPGSVHGPKEPYFLAVLLVLTALALGRHRPGEVSGRALGPATLGGGLALLLAAFFTWFPPGTWPQIPFLDDWPPRYTSTMQGLALLKRGALVGWEWAFLGGYHLSSDVTQSLTILAALPVALLGEPVGFHALHLALFLALPALVYADLRMDRGTERAAALAAGLVAIVSANFSYFLIRSGDTNSLAGTVCATATLVAAHAARRGFRGGPAALIAALTLTNYAHRGFFVYTLVFLIVDAAAARDRRSFVRNGIAAAVAVIAGLPLTWESWRYPGYFDFNNMRVVAASGFDWSGFARSVYYNFELLWLPGRWFNDYTGLAHILLPVAAFVALRARGRARFHALALLTVVAMVRLNDPQLGYSFARPIHMYVVFCGPVLASFLLSWNGSRALAAAAILFVALYIQIAWFQVPHVRTLRDFDAALVDHVATLDGHLVLIENNFHADVDRHRRRRSLPSAFGTHFEAMLPEATGRIFYAGLWDGWQWSPYRHQVLANGTFQGRHLDVVPARSVTAELRRWGIRHLVVWSDRAARYLQAAGPFVLRWSSGRWRHFEYQQADTRSVVVGGAGRGTLERLDPLTGRVRLHEVRDGATVVVRTNYHPSWTAVAHDAPVALHEQDGQLAFRAPRSGTYTVRLSYPRRRWLLAVAGAALMFGLLCMRRLSSPTERQRTAAGGPPLETAHEGCEAGASATNGGTAAT